jgi:AcrR family transcriptional regulator
MTDSLLRFPPSAGLRSRIMQTASDLILSRGYSQFLMEDLATELGVSKKTVYVYFPTKQALALEVIESVAEGVRASAEAILERADLSFTEKINRLVEGIVDRMAKVTPAVLRDIQRHEPEIYLRIDAVRNKAVPFIFSRILEEGRAAGLVRDDVPTQLAIDYHLHAIQGLVSPESLSRLDMTPADVADYAMRIFLNGMMLSAGQPAREKSRA